MELANQGEEEGPLLGVVRCLHIDAHGDVRLDTSHIDSVGGGVMASTSVEVMGGAVAEVRTPPVDCSPVGVVIVRKLW